MAQVSGGDEEHIALNVMPMLDIFSILILFLLMSFSTEPVSYDVTEGVEIPFSSTLTSLDEVPALRLTTRAIMVNDKAVAKITDGKVSNSSKFQGAVFPVFKELEKLADANRKIMKDKEAPLDLTLEVHKKHKFQLVKRVMKSAQQAQFITFNLMVEKEL